MVEAGGMVILNSKADPSSSYRLMTAVPLPDPMKRRSAGSKWPSLCISFKFKKAGVMLLDLVGADHAPQSLFDTHDPKDDKLIEAFDQIIRQQGPGTINFGTAGQASTWHSASAFRSPRYTTEWPDIPLVKT